MLAHFRGPQERCHAGTVDEMVTRMAQLEAAGVTRVYLQHPDRQDFRSIELMGELVGQLASE
jgi:hypothetical protein